MQTLPLRGKRRDDLRQARNAQTCGGVAEWSKAAVLKTVEPRGSVGSNPTASARKNERPKPSGVFCLRGKDSNRRGGNAFRKHASGMFLAFRPTELAREGCAFAKRRRESYRLRQNKPHRQNARFFPKRALSEADFGKKAANV